ncbi:twin-arginine translocase TatA/TatE family subunit [Oleisolibacter albus]|uniref:twin-arginine translocase TatA/TatE family subunit n=1 Tax=Oleisolibacter albus TaxID=2171757 RepID=UPI000DF35D7F|nr:twin-arginine translocase TatA/TatE family subunit [Oleisolibacter albus]
MSIGIWQILIILLIVLILFGAGKLPKVMGDVAKGVKNFKQGLKDDDEEAEPKVLRSDASVPPPAGPVTPPVSAPSSKDEAAKG